MPDICSHESNEVHRRNIITCTGDTLVISSAALPVISPAAVAYAPAKPILLRVTLHFHDETSATAVPAHEIIVVLLVLQQCSLVLCLEVGDILHMPFARQHLVQHLDYNFLVVFVGEDRLEAGIAHQIDILVMDVSLRVFVVKNILLHNHKVCVQT